MGTAFAVYLSGYVDSSIDEFEILASEQKRTSQIFVDDGMGNLSELEDQKLYMSENRVYVDYEDIPQNLIDAYISTEDKRFYDHNGVDWLRTIKATVYYALGNSAGGGSTLTQQLIKNATGNNDNTPQRKIGEIFQALNLEKNYSKEQILEMYLNTIYLSQGCYGVQSASYTYFGKSVRRLPPSPRILPSGTPSSIRKTTSSDETAFWRICWSREKSQKPNSILPTMPN